VHCKSPVVVHFEHNAKGRRLSRPQKARW
jgi:hypothetical protein